MPVYQCTLSPTELTGDAPPTLFIKFDRYRWFIVWSESDGMMHYEIPHRSVGLFTKVKKVGEFFLVYGDDRSLRGHFSTVSNSLTLQLSDTNTTHFSGTCTPTR